MTLSGCIRPHPGLRQEPEEIQGLGVGSSAKRGTGGGFWHSWEPGEWPQHEGQIRV